MNQQIETPKGRNTKLKWGAYAISFFAAYLGTASAIPAVERHMADGRLQWLRIPIIVQGLQIYEAPASVLAAVPGFRPVFEFLADMWCTVTNAPDTTA